MLRQKKLIEIDLANAKHSTIDHFIRLRNIKIKQGKYENMKNYICKQDFIL